jgi:excisionase family DNA binding protein
MENEIHFLVEKLCLLLKSEMDKQIQASVTKAIDEKLKDIRGDTYSDGLLTTPELQNLLSLSKSSIEVLKKKKMPFYKIGDNVRFNKREVLEFIQKYKKEGGSNSR